MRSAATTLKALELIAAEQPMGVSALARRLDVSKPAAQRAIEALAELNWVRRSDVQRGRWVLTPKPLDVASQVGKDLGVREIALPVMNELVDATSESAHLALPDGSEGVIIEEVESTQVVRIHWPVGRRAPMYASATGKAILASLPREHLDRYLPNTLTALTAHTIIDRSELHRELDAVADRGYAVQRGELRDDVASIAAPILRSTGQPVASLSVFIPTQRFPDDGGMRLGRMVREATDKIGGLL